MTTHARWGELTGVSKDKGPYKLAEVSVDGKTMDVMMMDAFGVQSNPHKGAQVAIFLLDGDEGKAIGFPLPRPKDRIDQQAEGEVTLKNHDAGQSLKLDKDGNMAHDAKGKITLTSGGELHLN